MDGLFNQAVSAEPDEVIPVLNLPFRVAHLRGTRTCRRHWLNRICVIRCIVRDYFANSAILDLLESFDDHVVIAPAKSCNQRDVLTRSLFGRGQGGPNSWCVSRSRFLA